LLLSSRTGFLFSKSQDFLGIDRPSRIRGVRHHADKRDGYQGQHLLTRCPSRYFQPEVVAPAATASLHGEALAAGMLLQQGPGQAIEPRDALAQVHVPDPRVILAIRVVERLQWRLFSTHQ